MAHELEAAPKAQPSKRRSRLAASALEGLSACVIAMLAASSAQAALITSATDIQQSYVVVDFSQFNSDTYLTATPVQVGSLVQSDVTAIGVGPFQRILVSIDFTIGGNGQWTTARDGYVSSNSGGGSITFSFNNGPVSTVGGLMNYALYTEPVLIQALDSGGAVLESYDVDAVAPISTPGGTDEGAFRGIARASADISAFRFTGVFTLLDDLTFSVPEPGTFALLSLGLLGLGFTARRRLQ